MKNVKSNHIKWSHAGISLLIIIGSVFVFREPLYNQLYSWDLIPKPEPYTELYFATTPPKFFVPGHPYSISFTLHNVEYQKTLYTYTIENLDGNDTVIERLAKDTLLLIHDEKKTTAVPITFSDNVATAKVRVTINFLEKEKSKTTTESIYYLIKRGDI